MHATKDMMPATRAGRHRPYRTGGGIRRAAIGGVCALALSSATSLAVAADGTAQQHHMEGAGVVSIGNPEVKATLDLDLTCPSGGTVAPPTGPASRLEVGLARATFTLTGVTSARCAVGDPNIIGDPNLHEGSGVGRCDSALRSVSGITVNWAVSDDGDGRLGGPDTRPDRVVLQILDRGPCRMAVDGPLADGNFGLNLVGLPSCFGLLPSIVGTSGPDILAGTLGSDVIMGLGGNDLLRGNPYFNSGSTSDAICGGDGNDVIFGGPRSDWLGGGAGDDALVGGDTGGFGGIPGFGLENFIVGGPGNDNLHGAPGSDVLNGGPQLDVCSSGPNFDDLFIGCEVSFIG